jgi:hypothetical protein
MVDLPGHRDVDTSIDAAEMMTPVAPRMRRIVIDILRHHPENLTVDEVCAIAKRPRYSLQPRFSELLKLGLIRDTGERRINVSGAKARVWRAVWLDHLDTVA